MTSLCVKFRCTNKVDSYCWFYLLVKTILTVYFVLIADWMDTDMDVLVSHREKFYPDTGVRFSCPANWRSQQLALVDFWSLQVSVQRYGIVFPSKCISETLLLLGWYDVRSNSNLLKFCSAFAHKIGLKQIKFKRNS